MIRRKFLQSVGAVRILDVLAGIPHLRVLAIMVIVAALLPDYLGATDHRVSTPAQIVIAMGIARPGDTLTMTNGMWTNAAIVFRGSGTAAAPILLRSESYGGVILTGASSLRISGRHLIVDGLLFKNGSSPSGDVIEFRGPGGESDSCRLTNCAITDYNPADSTNDNKWVSLYGTRNRVDHCYFRGKRNSGTTLVVWLSARPNYHQIDHNYFGFRPVLYGWNGGETIRIGTSDWSMYDSFTTVEYNLFEECNGEIEIISSKSCGNIYRYNTFFSCQGTLTLRHGNRCTVEGNFFLANRVPNSGGIRIIGEDHKVFNNYISGTTGTSLSSALTIMNGVPNSPLNRYFQVKRAVVAFNTFVDNAHTMNVGGGKDSEVSLPPLDCLVANNVVQALSSPLITLTDTPINMTWQGNIFFGATLGLTQPQGIAMINPQLALSADGLWRPTASSPVVNGAEGSFPYVTLDMDGQPRDGQFDVGADEISTTQRIRRPLTHFDVGPPQQLMTGVEEKSVRSAGSAPDFWLRSNYPNPFNPRTSVDFMVPRTGRAAMRVLNMLGQEVEVLLDGVVEGQRQRMTTFDASHLSSGVYFLQLQFEGKHLVQKMVYSK
jgi:poly(beta-D-mannuronate) lyase